MLQGSGVKVGRIQGPEDSQSSTCRSSHHVYKKASQQELGWPPRRLGHGRPWGVPSLIDQTSGGEPPDRTPDYKHDNTSHYVVDWRITVKGFRRWVPLIPRSGETEVLVHYTTGCDASYCTLVSLNF